MSDSDDPKARYPLRAVIRRTGLSADVIRAWERRYGAVAPRRSDGGQRLYAEDDVVRLALLQRATAGGHSIGEIARLSADALQELLDPVRENRGRGSDRAAAEIADVIIAEATAAAELLDRESLENTLKRAVFTLGADRFVDHVVGRLLRGIGDRWHRGTLSPAHEHLASNTVRQVLGWVSAAYDPDPKAPIIVIATPHGELHELGAMAVGAAALSAGWRVVYLGASLPAADIAAAANQVKAHVLALSVTSIDGGAAGRQLRDIAEALPSDVSFVVGGSAAGGVARVVTALGGRVLADVQALRRMLDEVREAGSERTSDRKAIA